VVTRKRSPSSPSGNTRTWSTALRTPRSGDTNRATTFPSIFCCFVLFCYIFSHIFFLAVFLPLSFCEIEDNASPAVEARSNRDGGPLVAQSRSTGLMKKQRGTAPH